MQSSFFDSYHIAEKTENEQNYFFFAGTSQGEINIDNEWMYVCKYVLYIFSQFIVLSDASLHIGGERESLWVKETSELG